MKRTELRASVVSDGTLAGTQVIVNGVPLEHVAELELSLTPNSGRLLVSVGEQLLEFGLAQLKIRDVPAAVRPHPSPRR